MVTEAGKVAAAVAGLKAAAVAVGHQAVVAGENKSQTQHL